MDHNYYRRPDSDSENQRRVYRRPDNLPKNAQRSQPPRERDGRPPQENPARRPASQQNSRTPTRKPAQPLSEGRMHSDIRRPVSSPSSQRSAAHTRNGSMGQDVNLSSMSTNRQRKSNKKHPAWLIATNVLLSLVLVFSSLALGGMTLLNSRFLQKSDIDQEEDPNLGLDEIVVSTSEKVSYFLVAGLDKSENLTDIILVVCYDLANNTANILQIPRDTFVGTDVVTGKVNAVYGHARDGESKIKALIRCINKDFGLPIDHYVTTTIEGFRNIVDAVGGVEVNLPDELRVYSETDNGKNWYTIGPGKVTLNGEQAEGFIRHRSSYAKGDGGRVEAQRLFYSGFAKKMTSLSFGQITNIAQSCFDDISTDMTLGKLLGYAQKASGIKMSDIEIEAVPGVAGMYSPTGQTLSYYSVNKQQYVNLLNEKFLPYEEKLITVNDIEVPQLHSGDGPNYIEDGGSFEDLLGDEE